METIRHAGVELALLFLLTAVPDESRPANPVPPRPTMDEVLRYLGFDPAEDRARVLAGDIVARDFRESSDEEVAVALVVAVPRPFDEVVRWVHAGEGLRADRQVVAFGVLSDEPVASDFAGVAFATDEVGEVRDLLRDPGGDRFNLSTGEIRELQSLGNRWPGGSCEASCLQAVNALYRRLLLDRALAYRRQGLNGIVPYARGKDPAHDPGAELRGAATSATLLARSFPAYYRALLEYPTVEPGHVSQLLWIKQQIQDRPTFILAHRLYREFEDGALITERYFYAGHSFDSLQVILGCLAFGQETIVFYTNRTSTAQVMGFAQGLRHSVARKRMIESVRARLEALQRGVTVASP